MKAWQKSSLGKNISNQMTQAWQLWLRRPTTKDTYFFAVDTDCSPIALAMLAVLVGERVGRLL